MAKASWYQIYILYDQIEGRNADTVCMYVL
jgi:hypothetical protein